MNVSRVILRDEILTLFHLRLSISSFWTVFKLVFTIKENNFSQIIARYYELLNIIKGYGELCS